MRKSLSLLLAFAMVFTMFAGVALADDNSAKAKLTNAGVIQGSLSGDTMDDQEWTREQLTVILSRLYGVEEEAKATEKDHTFADVTDPFYDGFITWAKNEGLINGHSDVRFGYTESVTYQQFATVLLRALDIEHDYADAVAAAVEAGIFGEAVENDEPVQRGDSYELIVNTLDSEVSEGVTLGSQLGLDGWVVEVADGEIASFKASGAKKLEVAFGGAVDADEAKFAVKRGSVTVAIADVKWNDANTVATLETVTKLQAGTYTVTVSGVELDNNVATAEVEAEKVANVTILSDIAPVDDIPSTKVTFHYEVLNQYGEDISSTPLTWTSSVGVPTQNDGVVTIPGAHFQINQTFVVTALHAESNLFDSKTLTVGAPAKVSSITEVKLNKDDEINTNSNYADFKIEIEGIDQYGNKASNDQLKSDVTVVNSNPSVITVPAMSTLNEKALTLAKPANAIAGQATVTFISNYTGQSNSITINVEAARELHSLVLESPDELVVQGESPNIPFTALDQHGDVLSADDIVALDATDIINAGTGITPEFVMNYRTNQAELKFHVADNATKGNRIVMAVTSQGKVSQLTVDVKEKAVPVAVTSTKDGLVTNFTIAGSSQIKASNIVVSDQYGRDMDLKDGAGNFFNTYKLVLASSDAGKVSLSGTEIGAEGTALTLTGQAHGDSTISVFVYNKSSDEVVADSDKLEFKANTLERSAIVSYEVEAPEVLYQLPSHAKGLNVFGKTSNGSKVALNPLHVGVSTNNGNVTYTAGNLVADFSGSLIDGDKEQTVQVFVIVDGDKGPVQVTKSVVVKGEGPKLATISADDTVYVAEGTINTNGGYASLFEFKDQYDVVFDVAAGLDITNHIVADVNGDFAVSGNGTASLTVTTAASPGDTFNYTIVANGISKTIKVVVTD